MIEEEESRLDLISKSVTHSLNYKNKKKVTSLFGLAKKLKAREDKG